MARLASAAKGGYFPAHPEAISVMLRHLAPPADGAGFFILDPCAGEGAAIKQLSEELGCRPEDTLAIELDEMRAEKLKAAMPDSQVLAPASLFGTYCTRHSVGMVYVNPPYDDQAGGGERVEFQFLRAVTPLLQNRGVLAWVVPQPVLDNYNHQQYLMANYQCLTAVTFPAKHRHYREIVLFGIRRSKVADPDELNLRRECRFFSGDEPLPTGEQPFRIPSGTGPGKFCKTEPVESELIEALDRSPLDKHLQGPGELTLASPPMSLGKGHIAMLLASGHLDGLVRYPGEGPHVVRGVAKKESYVQSVHVEETKAGTTTRTVKSEKIVLTIRALTDQGRIIELSQEGKKG